MAKKNKGNKKVTKVITAAEGVESVKTTEETKIEEKPIADATVKEEETQVIKDNPVKDTSKETAPVASKEEKESEKKASPKQAKEQKAAAPKKEEKVETVKVEVVNPPAIENTTRINTLASVMGKIGEGERVSVNNRILLMGMIKEAYLDPKGSEIIPPEIGNAMTQYFNFEAMNSVVACINQFQGDMEGLGIKVKPEAFESIRSTFATYLDMKLIGSKTSDGQMQINFKETMAKASPEVKEVIASEKKVQHTETLPKFVEGKTEAEYLADIRTIFSMKLGMGNNLLNGVEYGKKAFNMPKAPISTIIANIISKFGTQPCILISSFEQALFGSLTRHSNPFALHAWMGNILNIDDEKEVSDIVKVFLIDKLRYQSIASGKNCETEYIVPFSLLFAKFTDNNIEKLVEDIYNPESKGFMLQVPKLLIDPIVKKDIIPFIENRYGPIPEGTGEDLTKKRIREKLIDIAKLYREPLTSLDKYVEKSNLA